MGRGGATDGLLLLLRGGRQVWPLMSCCGLGCHRESSSSVVQEGGKRKKPVVSPLYPPKTGFLSEKQAKPKEAASYSTSQSLQHFLDRYLFVLPYSVGREGPREEEEGEERKKVFYIRPRQSCQLEGKQLGSVRSYHRRKPQGERVPWWIRRPGGGTTAAFPSIPAGRREQRDAVWSFFFLAQDSFRIQMVALSEDWRR